MEGLNLFYVYMVKVQGEQRRIIIHQLLLKLFIELLFVYR